MKNLFVYLAFVFAVVFLFGFAYSFNPEGGDGKSIFVEKKCNTCHSVEVADIESKKKDALDLSKTGDKYDAEFLAKFITKKEKIDDKEHKIAMKGSEEEVKTVAEWLASLKSVETK
ncbi:MAG: c-type cytochrome [Ignavibacteria bacterium]|nr:c-type cytochrome [Ignavibacteria bacterium]